MLVQTSIIGTCIISSIHLCFATYIGGILIFIKLGTTEKSLELEIQTSDTIRNIKEKIQVIEGIPTKQQILMLSEKELQNDFTISNYEIQSRSTINLV